MERKELKALKKGEFFTLVESEYPNANCVWVKDDYDRSSKKFGVYKWYDVNHWSEMKPTRKVWVGFTF